MIGIAETLPELISQAVACVATLIETMLDNIDMIIDTAIDLVVKFAKAIIDNIGKIYSVGKDIIDNTKKATKELAKEGQKNLDNILIANQKNLDNILIESKNNIKKIKEDYLKEIDGINSAVSSRANQLANPSNLFTDKEMTANGFIDNMQSSKNRLESFNEELKKVMKLDISDDMKAEFKKLGVDSLDELKVPMWYHVKLIVFLHMDWQVQDNEKSRNKNN